MAFITPIRGLRYNPRLVPDLAEVVTPPYDVIDEAAQEQYYQRNPYNVIRLEYGKIYPGDTDADNRYTRAGQDFARWRKDSVLIREDKPALYIYEQEFALGNRSLTRRGFFCGVRLSPYSEGQVLPHEETLPKAKADRLQLLRACNANFSPIFGLYADPVMEITGIFEPLIAKAPDIDFRDEAGQGHRLWVVADPDPINRVITKMAKLSIFIADGHHRYETALAYAQERNCPGPHNNVMMVLVNLYDPGLVILPTHRLAKTPPDFDPAALAALLEPEFIVTPFAGPAEEFFAKLKELGHHSFGLYAGPGHLYLLTVRPDLDLASVMPKEKSEAWRNLDVAILHQLIIEKHLGIGADARTREGKVKFTQEETGAFQLVDSGEFGCAFFLNPTGVEEMVAVAEAGEKMPQKSTYFYPKLITGLVINPLDLVD